MIKLYEDEDILAFDKPLGLLMHVGDKPYDAPTFLSLLLEEYPELSHINNPYPLQNSVIQLAGLVHRLDRDTSGVILVAKHQKALADFSSFFKEGIIQKEYVALVHGTLKEKQSITNALGREKKGFKRSIEGNPLARGPYMSAHTDVIPVSYDSTHDRTLVRLIPHTGRTHQLRAHLSSIMHPIVGDILYGNEDDKKEKRLYLHAEKITIPNGIVITSPHRFTLE